MKKIEIDGGHMPKIDIVLGYNEFQTCDNTYTRQGFLDLWNQFFRKYHCRMHEKI